ncbi:MAG TPA: two-component regulator propeller domain-containing protein, partial [Acidobacteriota bacterium]|nr:two-component regulator propeller domain-containing protein [Acidobacteriota bacterium]
MNLQPSTIWLGLCRMRKELSAQTDRQSLTRFGAKQSILWLGLLMAFLGWPGGQPRVCGQVYRFTSYSVNTGLPHNSVYCLFQDSQGYMWFGTESGVCRFDGLEYKTFTVRDGLADPVVRDIFEDRQNRLWIVTESGVSRFDGLRFTSFKAAQGFSPEEAYSGMCSRDG